MSYGDDIDAAWNEVNQSTDWAGMKKAGRVVAPSILPVAGAAALTPFLGPWAGPVAGGLAGEVGNNIIGLTQPSLGGYAVQALVPPGLRGGANVGKLWPKFGTSKRGAETLQEVGKKDLRLMQQEYQPLTPSSQLFERVGNEPIPMPHAKAQADAILKRIEQELPVDQPLYAKTGELAEAYKSLPDTGLPALKFQRSMSTLGQRQRAAGRGEERVGGSINLGNLKQLYGGFAKDLEAVQDPTLKRAREAFKRESTLEEIGEAAKVFTPKGHGEAEQISVNKLMDQLKDDTDTLGKFFHQAFSEQERKEILGRMGKINELPGLGPGTGQATGSSKVNPLLAGMLGIGGAGAMHGGTGEGLLAAGGLFGLSSAGRMARDVSIAWNIPAGKALIIQMLDRSGGKITPEVSAAIQAFAASQTAQLPKTLDVFKEPRQRAFTSP